MVHTGPALVSICIAFLDAAAALSDANIQAYMKQVSFRSPRPDGRSTSDLAWLYWFSWQTQGICCDRGQQTRPSGLHNCSDHEHLRMPETTDVTTAWI